jgi:hypothetical protein
LFLGLNSREGAEREYTKISTAGHWWLTPTIITQEAEIRRITVESQLRQIVRETLFRETHTHTHTKWLVEWLKV